MSQYVSITPKNVRKPETFLTLSGGIEIEKWLEMVNWVKYTPAGDHYITIFQDIFLTDRKVTF